MKGLEKWIARGIFFRSLWRWWRDRTIREGNSAKFLDESEERLLFSKGNQGLLLDGVAARISPDASFRNLAVIATTGAGKTSSFIIPNLLTLDHCSIVATDPSGTLYERTSGDLAARGFEVIKLDPTDLDGSVGFNPMDRAKTFPEMQEIAHILIRTSNQGAKVDPFWVSGAEEIVSIFVKCLKNHPDAHRYANLANLQYLLQVFGDGEALLPFVAATAPDDATYNAYVGFVSQSEKTMQGILSQAKSAITMLSDPDIARLTARSSLNFQSLRDRKTALFLVFPQNRISYYSLLANLFYTQLFHFCLDDKIYRPNSLPIHFLLDEFGHLAIPDFPSVITTTRARRISLSIVLQSISQLEERYGRQGAHTVMNGGVASRIFFSGMDIETASMLSRTIGETRYESMDAWGHSRSEKEYLMAPSAIRSMPDDQVLYLFANKRPTVMAVTPYFERPDLVRRTKLPPVYGQGGVADYVEFVPI